MSGYQVTLTFTEILVNHILQVPFQMDDHEYLDQVCIKYH